MRGGGIFVKKKKSEVVAALQRQQLPRGLGSLGIEAVTSSPESFDQLIRGEVQLFKKLSADSGIKAD